MLAFKTASQHFLHSYKETHIIFLNIITPFCLVKQRKTRTTATTKKHCGKSHSLMLGFVILLTPSTSIMNWRQISSLI